MNNNVVGNKIRDYRKQAGMTQGELGKLLNVSTQAVSRWEHGGMPDATLVPRIAEIIGCSLDDLFAIATAPVKTAEDVLTQEFQELPREQCLQRAVELAWHIAKLSGSMALGSKNTAPLLAMASACEDADLNSADPNSPTKCYFHFDEGQSSASVSSKFKYVLLMQEPKDGYTSILNSVSDYQRLFSIFSRENRLAVYLVGLTLPPDQLYTLDYVRAQLGLSHKLAKEAMDDLCDHYLLDRSSVQVYDHRVDSYSMPKNLDIIPFLYFGTSVMRERKRYFVHVGGRSKPMFNKPLVKDGGKAGWNPTKESNERSDTEKLMAQTST